MTNLYSEGVIEAIALYTDFDKTIRFVSEYSEDPDKILWNQSFWHKKVIRETSGLYVTDTLIRGAWSSFYASEMLNRRPKHLLELISPSVFPSHRIRVINQDFVDSSPWLRILTWDGKIYAYKTNNHEILHLGNEPPGITDIYGPFALVPTPKGTKVYLYNDEEYEEIKIEIPSRNTPVKILTTHFGSFGPSYGLVDAEGNYLLIRSISRQGKDVFDASEILDIGIWTYEPDLKKKESILIRALE